MTEKTTALVIRFSTAPGTVDENIAQVSSQVDEWLQQFEGLENASDDQLGEVKKKLTDLRAGKDLIEKERKRIKKKYLLPLEEFEGKVKPITEKIDKAIMTGKTRIEEAERIHRKEKKEQITAFWNSIRPQGMIFDIEQVWDERYFNKTGIGSETGWKKDLQQKADQIDSDLKAITDIIVEDTEKGNFIAEQYHKNPDLGKSLAMWQDHLTEKEKYARMAAEAEAKRAEIEKVKAERERERKAQDEECVKPVRNPDVLLYDLTFCMEGIPQRKVAELNAFLKGNGIPFHLLEQTVKDSTGNIVKHVVKDKTGKVIEGGNR